MQESEKDKGTSEQHGLSEGHEKEPQNLEVICSGVSYTLTLHGQAYDLKQKCQHLSHRAKA